MNIALIFAGGVGARMGRSDIPKQFLKVKNKEIILHTLEVFESYPEIDQIVCVCVKDWIDYLKAIIKAHQLSKVVQVVPGGDSPQASQHNGLKAIRALGAQADDLILVHDGVRPLINHDLLARNIAMAKEQGNAVTFAPAIETIVEFDPTTHKVRQIMNRSHCAMLRAPQTFRLGDLWEMHQKAIAEHLTFIDSASLMTHYGVTLHLVEGPAANIKVTTPNDYKMLEAIYDA